MVAGSLASLTLMLEFGAKPNGMHQGRPVVALAVEALNVDAVRTLLEFGADADIRDEVRTRRCGAPHLRRCSEHALTHTHTHTREKFPVCFGPDGAGKGA